MSSSDHARVADAIRILSERWRDPPPLPELASEVGLSGAHFQRMFRRLTGVSPKRFTQSLAADRAEALLRRRAPVLEAAHAAGLSGPGRLHDLTVNVRAMTPGELRRGAEGLSIAWGVHETPFGECAIAVTPRGVCELFFPDALDPEAELRARWPRADLARDEARSAPIVAALRDASRRSGPLTLHLKGTNFQLRVWKALLAIPHGEVTSYGALARSVGAPTAHRAVGNAVGRNPVSLLVPCHRVLRSSGALGGYRWGVDRKRALLAWEASERAVSPSRR